MPLFFKTKGNDEDKSRNCFRDLNLLFKFKTWTRIQPKRLQIWQKNLQNCPVVEVIKLYLEEI